jgi:hypothetical protein
MEWNMDSLQWENKKYTNYNFKDFSVLQTYFDWNTIEQNWDHSYSIQKFFGDDNEKLGSLTKRWDQELSNWGNSQKDTFYYENHNKPTEFISYLWEKSEKKWYINQYSSYSYNEKGLMISEIDSYYDLLIDKLIQTEKCEYFYADSIWQETIIYVWNQNTLTWEENAMQANYFISPFPATRNDELGRTGKVHIYPNPCSDILYFKHSDFGEYELYNMHGNLIKQDFITANSFSINLSSLPSGVYLIKLQSETQHIIQKLIKINN